MLFDESAIKVLLSYEPGESKERFGSVKLMPSGTGRGSSSYCCGTNAENVEQVCDEVIDSIIRAATNPQTVEKDKFKFMGLVLEDQARVVWQQAAQNVGVDPLDPDDGDFDCVVKEFFNKRTHTNKMRDNVLRYLEMGVKKPRDWDPLKYESRFMKILKNAEYFNGIKPSPTDDELKDWYLRSYPKAYRADYLKKGTKDVDDIADITKHMTYLHAIDEAEGKLKIASPRKKKSGDRKKDRKSSRRGRKYYKGDRDDRRSSKSGYRPKNKEFVVPDDAHCPAHPDGSHVWGECSLNPANRKDRDSDRKRDRGERKREDKKGKKYSSHSHHLDQSEAEDESSHSHSDGEVSSSSKSNVGSGSDSESSTERRSKRRAASHHNSSSVSAPDVGKLKIVDGFDGE